MRLIDSRTPIAGVITVGEISDSADFLLSFSPDHLQLGDQCAVSAGLVLAPEPEVVSSSGQALGIQRGDRAVGGDSQANGA